jgi:hypothetical protein
VTGTARATACPSETVKWLATRRSVGLSVSSTGLHLTVSVERQVAEHRVHVPLPALGREES